MRKVKYHLEKTPSLMDRVIHEELKDLGKERDGVFHGWGSDAIFIAVTENAPEANLQVSRAIIEDVETKKVHLVYPEYVTFLD